MKHSLDEGVLTLWLAGRINSVNSPETEREINNLLGDTAAVVLDCEQLEYISSAGLRILLRTAKAVPCIKLVNVHPEVYDIFEMTGFTEMMEIHRAYRVISLDGCELIGQGANGRVYRIDRETVVKAYIHSNALADIQKERELARTAFVLGVPTAIPYDVVRIAGGGYGSVFELLNATNFSKLLLRGEKTVDEIVKMSVDLLKIIHATEVKPSSMPSMKEIALGWADFLSDYLPEKLARKLHALIAAVEEDNHMIHGDFHIKNITRQGDENLILDMDTLAHGHAVFEFASMFNAYIGFYVSNQTSRHFLGIDYETGVEIWNKSLRMYFEGADEAAIRAIEEKAMILGYARLLRRRIRRGGFETKEGRREIACCQAVLAELLPRVDSLTF